MSFREPHNGPRVPGTEPRHPRIITHVHEAFVSPSYTVPVLPEDFLAGGTSRRAPEPVLTDALRTRNPLMASQVIHISTTGDDLENFQDFPLMVPRFNVRYQLKDGCEAYFRPGPSLQFGLGSNIATVIPFANVEQCVGIHKFFCSLDAPVTAIELVTAITATGLPRAASVALVQELMDFEVLIPIFTHRPALYLSGPRAWGDLFEAQLDHEAARLVVRDPQEPMAGFLESIPMTAPLLVADPFPLPARTILQLVKRNCIPLMYYDGAVFIGPWRQTAADPCVNCLQLWLLATDPHLDYFLQQHPFGAQVIPRELGHGVLNVLSMILPHAGIGLPSSAPPTAGGVWRVASGQPVEKLRLNRHPVCTLCGNLPELGG